MTRPAAVFRSRLPRLALACGAAALAAAGPASAAPAAAAGTGSVRAAAHGPAADTTGTAAVRGATRPAGTVTAATLDTAPAQQVTVAITSLSPQVARPGKPVTVSGTVTNGTKTPVSGLAVQLWSSTTPLSSRSELASYAAGQLLADSPLPAITPLAGALGAGATRSWTLTATAASLGMTSFGAYPLAAQVSASGVPLNAEHTFLPFWPGSIKSAQLTQREKVAWIWPLTAPPERVACPALLNNDLAASFPATGRLGSLLAAGSSPAGTAADLTWAIDPSLLTSAAVMSKPYGVGGTAACTGAASERASPAAQYWLGRLRTVTAGQDFFVTPYADVDVAALTHAGLSTDLTQAYATGLRVALDRLQLGVTQRAAGVSGQIAWPADGIADYAVLGNLAAHGVGTVILSSSMMPPPSPAQLTPSAITTTPDGVNAGLRVALADSTLTQVLSAPAATAGQSRGAPAAAGTVATVQRVLAETAVLASEQPSVPQSVVIAPPRQWNPVPGLASALLTATDSAPWLSPESLAGLLTARPAPGQVARQAPPAQLISRVELRRRLLRRVKALESVIQMQASMLGKPTASYLPDAVAAIESSAWRGDPAQVRSLLARVSGYLDVQMRQVRIIDAGQVTLTGKSGPVPVSIINRLGEPVTVQLSVQAPASRITVLKPRSTVTIGPHQQRTVAVRVRSSVAGSTMLTLTLLAPDGQPLPGTTAQLTVDATHFGTTALVIIAVAIGVFVITSVTRAIRRGIRGPGTAQPDSQGAPDPDGAPEARGAAPEASGAAPEAGAAPPGPGAAERSANGADSGGSPGERDTVVTERMPDHETAEEPDEYARARGRVEHPR